MFLHDFSEFRPPAGIKLSRKHQPWQPIGRGGHVVSYPPKQELNSPTPKRRAREKSQIKQQMGFRNKAPIFCQHPHIQETSYTSFDFIGGRHLRQCSGAPFLAIFHLPEWFNAWARPCDTACVSGAKRILEIILEVLQSFELFPQSSPCFAFYFFTFLGIQKNIFSYFSLAQISSVPQRAISVSPLQLKDLQKNGFNFSTFQSNEDGLFQWKSFDALSS